VLSTTQKGIIGQAQSAFDHPKGHYRSGTP
jgi:hypothetical protein